ncbi:uncharacterized protein LOC116027044 [Ipomoea triloba]|uniref:uncharacterized protein LOC116027044 n=1 Tax=Ipomoea triloba TaxID=35885 RepID=UPI00125DF33A|nr:uncharacterized protein LOC116027044 [Ipomoea triloba]
MSILTDIFLRADVVRISRLPISPTYDDAWFWHGDPRGCYTVRNGYRRIVGEVDYSSSNFGHWNSLWKLKVPPKWKIFLWRTLNNIFPVTTNLLLRRVEVDPTCSMCGLAHENVMHALVLCEYSSMVWHVSALHVPSVLDVSFATWFPNLMVGMSEDNINLTVAVLYSIWQARNSAVWEGCLPLPKAVATKAASSLHAWRSVHHADVLGGGGGALESSTHSTVQQPQCYFDVGHFPDS